MKRKHSELHNGWTAPKRTNAQHPGGDGKRTRDIWGVSQGLPVDHFLPTGFIYPGYVRHQAVLRWYSQVTARGTQGTRALLDH